jgi:SAM-dependent methyltransferase
VTGAPGSEFGARLFGGETTSPEEWRKQLREFHARLPGSTSALCSRHATTEGETSYDVLVDVAIRTADDLDRPIDLLDLACGDGYLIERCLDRLEGRLASVTGIDMSEAELDAARERLNAAPIRLKQGLAQRLPLQEGSVDVTLCHLAFMLMLPVEPVVKELARVLRPGGRFAAVVGSTTGPAVTGAAAAPERELWARLSVALRGFWQTRYPQLRTDGRAGDARTLTPQGWRELFLGGVDFTGDVELREFEILVQEDSAESVWRVFEDTYLVALLDTQAKAELRHRLIREATEHERAHGTVTFAFPHRLLSVRRG